MLECKGSEGKKSKEREGKRTVGKMVIFIHLNYDSLHKTLKQEEGLPKKLPLSSIQRRPIGAQSLVPKHPQGFKT